jgi:radical SAM superfamily enzyme YgiQ (UPF0313 family)
MKVKMILPVVSEKYGRNWKSIKYSLFPPLGLATLAGYLNPDDEITIQDEHVETLDLDDEPDLVVIQTYSTSAYRSYRIAEHYRRKGAHVCLGGLHVTTLPREAAPQADSIFVGPGEDTWPRFLEDYRNGRPKRIYRSTVRDLDDAPTPRRDLLKLQYYLLPNTIVVSRGCPHNCAFCYKNSFYAGGSTFYTQRVDKALEEIDRLPGRRIDFLDDNLFGDPGYLSTLLDGLKGAGKIWQGAATVQAVLSDDGMLEKAVRTGLRALFIGFESLSQTSLKSVDKVQNLEKDYNSAVAKLRDLGVIVNAGIVFGLDDDGPDVFQRTVDWAISQGIEKSSFHILTPYPGTKLFDRLNRQGRILTKNWDLYDTQHAVFKPARMTSDRLEEGYWWARKHFYSLENTLRAAAAKTSLSRRLRHLVYTLSWSKCTPVWDFLIRHGLMSLATPILERVYNSTHKRNEVNHVNTNKDRHHNAIVDDRLLRRAAGDAVRDALPLPA